MALEITKLEQENNSAYDKEKSKRIPWFLYFSGLTANLLLVFNGISMGWSSPVISKLKSNDTNINPLGTPITTVEVSTLAATPFVTAVFGYIIFSNVIDIIGRKKTMNLLAVLLISSLLATAFATNINVYFVTIAITGICNSGSIIAVPIYNTEIAEDCNRGKLGTLMACSIPFGILIAYIIGSIATVKSLTLICSLPVFLFIVLSPILPESPTYLVSKEKISEACKTLEKLRGNRNIRFINLEYDKIRNTIISTTISEKRRFVDVFKTPSTRKAFLLGVEAYAVQQFSGILVILSYIVPIFNEVHSGLSGSSVGITVGSVQCCMYLITAFFIDKLGRRTFMLFSSLSCTFPMFFLGLYFYLKHMESDLVQNIRWISILLVILYITFYAVGMGPIPISFVSEMFPEDLRAKGVAIIFILDNFMSSTILFSFPLLAEAYGLYSCFWFHSVTCLIGFIGLYITMPETNGKTFLEIQKNLNM